MLLKCWLLLAIADHDVIHFGRVHDNQRLVNIIQAVLVIDIYFFTRLQNATDTTCFTLLVTTRSSTCYVVT